VSGHRRTELRRPDLRRPDLRRPDLRRPELVAAAAAACCLVCATAVFGPLAGTAAGAGCWWVVRGAAIRTARAARLAVDPDLSIALELVAAALRAGRPVADAVAIGAALAGAEARSALTAVAARLRVGAADAWQPAAGVAGLGAIAAIAARSSVSGARLAATFDRLAARLRAEASAAALARAHRAGVLVMLPLGLCYLPAFVCLGVVPVVVGVARTAFANLR
jgi:Flp pilus assembly protein TadB